MKYIEIVCEECSYKWDEPDHAEALAEALRELWKASGQVKSKVEFSIEHSIRACAHQEFIAEDREDLSKFNKARANAEATLDAYRKGGGA